jgi:hypothetical protein
MLEQLLGNWGLASVVSVVALLASTLTVQLTYLVRSKERLHRERLMAMEETNLQMIRELEMQKQLYAKQVSQERIAIRNQLIAQQLELLRDDLDRISPTQDSEARLVSAKKILSMLEESLKTLVEV